MLGAQVCQLLLGLGPVALHRGHLPGRGQCAVVLQDGNQVLGKAFLADILAQGAAVALGDLHPSGALAHPKAWQQVGVDGQVLVGVGVVCVGGTYHLLQQALHASGHLVCCAATAPFVEVYGVLDMTCGVPAEVDRALRRWRRAVAAAKHAVEHAAHHAADGPAYRPAKEERTHQRAQAAADMFLKVVERQCNAHIGHAAAGRAQCTVDGAVERAINRPARDGIDARDDARRVAVLQRLHQAQRAGCCAQVPQVAQCAVAQGVDAACQAHQAA